MTLTNDPTDPRLGRGVDNTPVSQNDVYLVLSEEERNKGFVRPVRESYMHVGEYPKYPLRDLTDEEQVRYGAYNYVKFEPNPEYPEKSNSSGRFWTQEQLNRKGCRRVTRMGRMLAETYARDPKFYGATYCCYCMMHRPVAEFVWEGTGEAVGS